MGFSIIYCQRGWIIPLFKEHSEPKMLKITGKKAEIEDFQKVSGPPLGTFSPARVIARRRCCLKLMSSNVLDGKDAISVGL